MRNYILSKKKRLYHYKLKKNQYSLYFEALHLNTALTLVYNKLLCSNKKLTLLIQLGLT